MALNSHHHWHRWPTDQVLLWVMLLCKCCHCSTNTKSLAIAKVLLPERHRLNAVARAPEQRSPPKAGFYASIHNSNDQFNLFFTPLIPPGPTNVTCTCFAESRLTYNPVLHPSRRWGWLFHFWLQALWHWHLLKLLTHVLPRMIQVPVLHVIKCHQEGQIARDVMTP